MSRKSNCVFFFFFLAHACINARDTIELARQYRKNWRFRFSIMRYVTGQWKNRINARTICVNNFLVQN